MANSAARRLPIAALALLMLLVGWQAQQRASANHTPADKVIASGSAVEVMGPNNAVELLKGTLRTSAPADLILAVTAECSIVTDVTTVGNDSQTAFGQVRVWVTVDGSPVKVSSDDTGDSAGKVVFCNRNYTRTTSMFDDEDATIATFIKTREANAFNWLRLNLGAGTHTIVVMAELTKTESSDQAHAEAAVGKRTLIVQPAKLANDATI